MDMENSAGLKKYQVIIICRENAKFYQREHNHSTQRDSVISNIYRIQSLKFVMMVFERRREGKWLEVYGITCSSSIAESQSMSILSHQGVVT